ncbi:MAG: hypothetical protein ACYC5Q_12160 [Thermoleophilia bacterium]
MEDRAYRTLRPGRVVVVEYRPVEDLVKGTRTPSATTGARGVQPTLSWAIYLGERFDDDGPRGWFGLPDGNEIDDRQVLWHFIPLGPSDHPETQASFLRRLRLRTISLRLAHPRWFKTSTRRSKANE